MANLNSGRKSRCGENLIDTRMKRLYNTLEPTVINHKLLSQAIYEQGPKNEAGRIAKEEGINFGTVKSLRLDFKNILYINNIWQLTNLTHLQLVHNLIERIENLENLVNLEWLDLSFNKIEKIENLDKLVNLTDLSLCHNLIRTLENLDQLEKLNVFSIGRNHLTSMNNVMYLTNFKCLQSLNLSGNPLCKNTEYYSLIFAFFPNLMFLDYKMITKDEHKASYEKYQIKVEQFQEKQLEQDKLKAEQKQINESREIHRKAFVEFLDTDAFFNKLVNSDPDKDKIFAITGIEDYVESFHEKFNGICNELFQIGLKELERRNRDTDLFYRCINAAKKENNQKARDLIDEFNLFKEEVFHDINQNGVTDEYQMTQLKEKIYNLWNDLMSLEVQLYDQLEDTIKDYLRNITEMVDSFLENCHNNFSQLRDMETAFNDRINEAGSVVFDKVHKGDMDEEKMNMFRKIEMFNDRDVFINTLAASHDFRMVTIDGWQDSIKQNALSWVDENHDYIKATEEHERNRNRITEINNFIDNARSEIENIEVPAVALN